MSTIRSKVGARIGMAAGTLDVVSSVIERQETALKTVCTGNGKHAPTPVKQFYRCPVDQAEGKITDFVKAKEVSKNSFVEVPADELEKLQVSDALKDNLVFAAYPREQVEVAVVPNGKPYYLKPTDTAGVEPYSLFKRLVEQTADTKVIMAIWSAKGAPVLWRLRVINNVLAIQPYCWPNQLDAAPEIPLVDVSKYDVMIPAFIDAISAEFKPEEFRDERADTLQAFVSTQTAIEGIATGQTADAVAAPIDLMAALAATVASNETPAKKPRKRAPAKKTA